jgi:hypothetical protein
MQGQSQQIGCPGRKDMQERIQGQSEEIGYSGGLQRKVSRSEIHGKNTLISFRRLDIRVQSTEKKQEIGYSD